MAKRQKVLERGEEEPWRWQSFGGNMPVQFTQNLYYAHEHELEGAGVRYRGKVSMLECSKIAFYVEPYPIVNSGGFMNHYMRFALSAEEFQLPIVYDTPFTGGLFNIHRFLDKPSVYWVQCLEEAKNWGESAATARGYAYQFPIVHDVTSPDGQGILFKGKNIWSSAMSDVTTTPKEYASCSFTFRCLCRTVWVTPQYWVTAKKGVGNFGIGGIAQ